MALTTTTGTRTFPVSIQASTRGGGPVRRVDGAAEDVLRTSGGPLDTPAPLETDVALDTGEVALLQACVGFHARAQTDPGIRDRLYRLWCKLDVLKHAA